ncbi:hypothetical protein KFZ56_03555 [Virgibacillus sp. NKC19-3]|uniref:hypothetical protein n=1 Tax=Virgibacillus saliphilus TaxID=2831674 RepID=UPI001C9B303B|nr:hypothetical protein [Virgibacillus sp. NKC19-3]MBY7142181.1 hypothetical protein [Virgibacillus sp. NKC19-3]
MGSERCIMIQLNELKREFAELGNLPKHERMMEICALLTEYFQKDNIKPIIVGGLSVEIYTRNNYSTYDIDLITDGITLAQAPVRSKRMGASFSASVS